MLQALSPPTFEIAETPDRLVIEWKYPTSLLDLLPILGPWLALSAVCAMVAEGAVENAALLACSAIGAFVILRIRNQKQRIVVAEKRGITSVDVELEVQPPDDKTHVVWTVRVERGPETTELARFVSREAAEYVRNRIARWTGMPTVGATEVPGAEPPAAIASQRKSRARETE